MYEVLLRALIKLLPLLVNADNSRVAALWNLTGSDSSDNNIDNHKIEGDSDRVLCPGTLGI
jgi:hypothetical protein